MGTHRGEGEDKITPFVLIGVNNPDTVLIFPLIRHRIQWVIRHRPDFELGGRLHKNVGKHESRGPERSDPSHRRHRSPCDAEGTEKRIRNRDHRIHQEPATRLNHFFGSHNRLGGNRRSDDGNLASRRCSHRRLGRRRNTLPFTYGLQHILHGRPRTRGRGNGFDLRLDRHSSDCRSRRPRRRDGTLGTNRR